MAHREGPWWVWWFFLVALTLFTVHCGVRCMVGRGDRAGRREEHASHALMAGGMAYMFGPVMGGVVVRTLWQAAFTCVAAYFAWSAMRHGRDDRRAMLWSAHHAACNLAMVYMLAMPELSILTVTTVLIAYFMGTCLIDGRVLVQDVSQRVARRLPDRVTHGGRIVTMASMAYMLAIMDDVGRAGVHLHHLG